MPKYRDLYKKLQDYKDLSEKEVLHEEEFEAYMDNVARKAELSETDKKVRDIIVSRMAKNQAAENALKEELPNAAAAKKKYIQDLKRDAQTFARADTKKKEAAQIKARRKAAKKELEEIRQRRIINKANTQKEIINQDDLKEPKLYEDKPTNWARRRNPLIRWMNNAGLGTRSERRGLDENGKKDPRCHYETAYPGAELIEHKSLDGKIKLTGAKFESNMRDPEKPERVALVFSGSGGTGAQYIESIKNAYLSQGITVVQLDYRGFGTSSNFDPKTQKDVSNSPSERTMYEDGMEMYRYVNEVMGIKPENITLHGFSLGGAIASRVALEATKKIQNERIMDGDKYDKTKGLGGVVLHSPMKSMYSAASSKTVFGPVAGFFGWAFGGGYNTEEHMLELAKIDKDVPVHLIGGDPDKNSNNFDDLSPEVTGLDRSLTGKFNHVTSYRGEGDHEGKTWTYNEETRELEKEADVPNVVREDRRLSSILELGREANPVVRQEMQRRRANQNAPQMGQEVEGGGPAMM